MTDPMNHAGHNEERHECYSERKDQWIIFRCPQCDYVRRMNWETGEMKVRGGDYMVLHGGFHFPTGINPDTNMN
ncbi:MAG: hypothetical protein HUU01_24020 [Saprospiraceae bacterium]|nr:hypothetical protein [Saprospiraceae bacterium]